jgi:hypothetical protein
MTLWTVNYYVGSLSVASQHEALWCLPRKLRIRCDV